MTTTTPPRRKKPRFIQQSAHKLKRLSRSWRRPRGIDSKLRLHLKGHRASPSPGHKAPLSTRGTIKGKETVLVSCIADLEKVNPTEQIAIVSGTVGMRAKRALVEAATSRKITLHNVTGTYLKDSEAVLAERKKTRTAKKRRAAVSAKKEKDEKKAAKKEGKAKDAGAAGKKDAEKPALTPEEKKEQEKKEMDKILTSKDA